MARGSSLLDPTGFFDTLGARTDEVEGLLPEGAVVAIHVEGPGGGEWQLGQQSDAVRLGPIEDGPKDCVIRCSAEDFMAILTGQLGAKQAFLTGRLRIVGDVGLALRLHELLSTPDA